MSHSDAHLDTQCPSLDQLLEEMAQREASDLYLAVGAPPSALVQGKLELLSPQPLGPGDTEALARQAMDEQQFHDFQLKLEANLAYKIAGWRFRLNIYYQRGSIALVARLIRQNILSFEKLGLPPILGQLVMAQRGIVLVTGATGSGKSTTLAAMIDYRNRNSTGHIVTIEDPIEFLHEHQGCIVSQREVGIDTHSFHEALKSALRQAPNVILIGEIRDQESAQFALHASDTGHLVLATLHTNNASQTLERLINLFPPEGHHTLLLQLSLNLQGVVCQRLVPAKEGGRTPAIELLLNTSRVQELVQQGKIHELRSVMAKSANEGMQTFDAALHQLIKSGTVQEEVALKYADSANDLKLRLRGFGGSGFGE